MYERLKTCNNSVVVCAASLLSSIALWPEPPSSIRSPRWAVTPVTPVSDFYAHSPGSHARATGAVGLGQVPYLVYPSLVSKCSFPNSRPFSNSRLLSEQLQDADPIDLLSHSCYNSRYHSANVVPCFTPSLLARNRAQEAWKNDLT